MLRVCSERGLQALVYIFRSRKVPESDAQCAVSGDSWHWFTTSFLQGRCRKAMLRVCSERGLQALVYIFRSRKVPESDAQCAVSGDSWHWFTTSFLQGRCRKAMLRVCSERGLQALVYIFRSRKVPESDAQCAVSGDSWHWFTTSFLQGRCRKAMLSVCSERGLTGTAPVSRPMRSNQVLIAHRPHGSAPLLDPFLPPLMSVCPVARLLGN